MPALLRSHLVQRPNAPRLKHKHRWRRRSESSAAHAATTNLNAAEGDALAAFKKKFYMLSDDEMPGAAFGALLEGTRTRRMPPEVMQGAMVYIDQASSSGRLSDDYRVIAVDAVFQPTYQLVFSTTVQLKQLQYMPIREDLAFKRGAIFLTSYLGPLQFELCGEYDAQNVDGPAMDFRFKSMDVRILSRRVAQRDLSGKAKTYWFIGQGKGLLVVRSSLGGMSLWVRADQKPTQRPNIDFLATKL